MDIEGSATCARLLPRDRDCDAAEVCRGVTRLGGLPPDPPEPRRSVMAAAEVATWSPFVMPFAMLSASGASMLPRRAASSCACCCFWILHSVCVL